MNTCFERYYQELLNFCARMTRCRDTAADVVQETYVRVLSAQHTGTDTTKPRALLYRTARNLLVDTHRRDAVRGRHESATPETDLDELAAPPDSDPETAAMSTQAVQALLASIQALPPRCRQAFVLHRFEGLSHAEVASRMGISRKMVEQHIKLAMQACHLSRLEQENAGRATANPAQK